MSDVSNCQTISVYYLMSVHIVPNPTSTLNISNDLLLYEGTLQTMNCTVTLPDTVNTDVTVTVDWILDSTNTIITTTDRVMVSRVSSVMSPFISSLTFNPLIMNDAGQYSCHATADSSSQYITTSNPGSSSVETITVTGILTCIV